MRPHGDGRDGVARRSRRPGRRVDARNARTRPVEPEQCEPVLRRQQPVNTSSCLRSAAQAREPRRAAAAPEACPAPGCGSTPAKSKTQARWVTALRIVSRLYPLAWSCDDRVGDLLRREPRLAVLLRARRGSDSAPYRCSRASPRRCRSARRDTRRAASASVGAWSGSPSSADRSGTRIAASSPPPSAAARELPAWSEAAGVAWHALPAAEPETDEVPLAPPGVGRATIQHWHRSTVRARTRSSRNVCARGARGILGADHRARVARKRDDRQGPEHRVDGAALETELAKVRARQQGARRPEQFRRRMTIGEGAGLPRSGARGAGGTPTCLPSRARSCCASPFRAMRDM